MGTSYQEFLAALRMRESSGNYRLVNTLDFLGAYQFGEGALVDLGFVRPDDNYRDNNFSGGWTGKLGIDSKAEFLNSSAAQDAAADAWFPLIWRYLTAIGADDYLGRLVGGTRITASGLLAGAHLLGAGAVLDWLASGGTNQITDAYGTPITEYIGMFAGYSMPFDTGDPTLYDIAPVLAALPDATQARIEATFADSGSLLAGDDGADRLVGHAGKDVISGAGGNDTLHGKAGGDALLGGSGDDVIEAGAGWDLALGGDGADRILGERGKDTLHGDGGDDALYGGGHHDRLFGGDGLDLLAGGRGNDKLFGGAGDDVLRGGGGGDRLSGDTGNDRMIGGAQADTFIFTDGSNHDVIVDFNRVEGDRIRLSDVASITNFADLKTNHATQIGGDVVIETASGETLTLLGVSFDALTATDFEF